LVQQIVKNTEGEQLNDMTRKFVEIVEGRISEIKTLRDRCDTVSSRLSDFKNQTEASYKEVAFQRNLLAKKKKDDNGPFFLSQNFGHSLISIL
jgi:hypothetical protein